MRSLLTYIILTLVVVTVFFVHIIVDAAPHSDSAAPTAENSGENVKSSYTESPEKMQNISITEVPALSKQHSLDRFAAIYNRENYYYPYRQELSIHAGVVLGVLDSSDDEDLANFIIGFNYLLPAQLSPKWSMGAQLSTVGHGHVHVSKRVIFNEKGAFRPHYEYGVMHKVVPDEKMSSLSNADNYLFRASLAFSDIGRPPRSSQYQLVAAAGMKDVLVMATFGYSWGF